jgi:hypothetical protein
MAVFSTADFAAGFGFGLQQNSLLVRCWRMERQEFQGDILFCHPGSIP